MKTCESLLKKNALRHEYLCDYRAENFPDSHHLVDYSVEDIHNKIYFLQRLRKQELLWINQTRAFSSWHKPPISILMEALCGTS
jgi:hypothetical protein